MKKLFAIAFTCVYLLLTVGVTKNTHYCMGRINPSPLASEAPSSLSETKFFDQSNDSISFRELEARDFLMADKTLRNSAEFFIISDLYSEAFVILLA